MKFIPRMILLLLTAVSCSTARYARGMDSADIESLQGYDGTIRAVSYPSRERNIRERRMVVYLPPSYYNEPERRYPVLYLLHGARGNETTWIQKGNAFHNLDSLVRLGAAKEFIVVLPNMNRYFSEKDYKNGHAVNAVRAFWLLNGEAERHFATTAVHWTDSLFRTIPTKEARALVGMSSGALQTVYLSAGNPDVFGYVGLFSPYTYPTVFALGHLDVYSGLWKKLKRQFQDPPSSYDIIIGRRDFFLPHILLYDNKLSRRGYRHTLTVTKGGHTWKNWELFLVDFYGKVFQEN